MWFALAVVLVPPLLLWGLGCLIGAAVPRAREIVHGITLGGLVGLAVMQAIRSMPLGLLVALVAGTVAGVLVVRSPGVRLWSQVLVVLPAYALAVFVISSPAGDLINPSSLDPAAAGHSNVPVVLIILDEFPTASIVTSSGTIDPVRFPHLAGFARDATWYRNATSVAPSTPQAVPAILTGQLPRRAAPVSTDYPDNIFRLMSGTHDLVVSETITKLCPTALCGDEPTAPSAKGGNITVGADMGGLFGDAASLWVDQVTGRQKGSLRTEQFQESVSEGSAAAGSVEAPSATEGTDLQLQPKRLTTFLDALQPARRPIAAVLHLVSPHSPWRFLPDGRRYADPAEDSGLSGVYLDDWVASVGRQTHLLQASYTDRLVGKVLDRLKALHMYDDAAVAVVADHGVSFAPNQMRRGFTTKTAQEIMFVPMLVKPPGAKGSGAIDETNVETIDLLPALAHMAGLEIPWKIDGVEPGKRKGDKKTFMRFNNAIIQPEPDARLTVDGRAPYRQMLGDDYPHIDDTDDPSAGLYELSGRPDLMGRPSTTTGQPVGKVSIDDEDRLESEKLPVLTLSGTVDGIGADHHVVVSAGGVVVAVSPIVTRRDGHQGFEVVLPDHPVPALHDLTFSAVEDDQTTLRPLTRD